ncbi:GNAT family N-acetyltransferase [Calidifontibacter terrae]
MTRPVLVTPRIELRPMRPEHLPLLHHLDTNPAVTAHLLPRPRTAVEIDEFWEPRCADRSLDALGLGWWVGFRRDTDEFLGWWDLGARVPFTATGPVREASAGWRLEPRHWKQGFASEGAREVLRHGFDTVGLLRVTAETMAVNAASRGVMRSIGMRHVATDVRQWADPIEGWELGEVTYELTAAQRTGKPDQS